MIGEYIDVEQGSEEWLQSRVGSLGASKVHEAIARTKSGWGASRANCMATLIAERLTSTKADTFTNAAMQWGTEHEPDARAAYEFQRDVDVTEVGLYRHSTIAGTHASPDGIVGEEGLIEIKAPNTATHIQTLLTGKIPDKYIVQMQWQMICTDRQWTDHISYDPRMPPEMRLWIKRVERDDDRIAKLEADVSEFLQEMETKLNQLQGLYAKAA